MKLWSLPLLCQRGEGRVRKRCPAWERVLLALAICDFHARQRQKCSAGLIRMLQNGSCDKTLSMFKIEVCVLTVEFVSPGPSTTTETETIAKYEIMDGAPVKGK